MARRASALGLAFVLALILCPARASLTLCNRTSYIIYAATAELSGADVSVHGWTRIVPGACQEGVKGDLVAQGYFLYAKSSRAHSGAQRDWSGNTDFCVKDRDFFLRQPFGARCPADAYQLGFAAVATQHLRSFTTTFRENPDLASMPAAERAGQKRLLQDTGVGGLYSDGQIAAAIGQFRKRMHLPDKAPAAALFDALETQAMKNSGPAGYTVCNDTNGEFWVALGLKKGNVFLSRGWWSVGGGACAPLVTDSLAGQKVWLRVERAKGAPLVGGPMPFCTANIEFEIQGRDRCKERGLNQTGFAETNLKGQAGFTAHVAAGGLTVK